MNQTEKTPKLFVAADQRHYKDIEGLEVFACRDSNGQVQIDIKLAHRTRIDEHWLKKLVICLINPSIDFQLRMEIEEILLHHDGYGSLLRSAWTYAHTGLSYFHPTRSVVEIITPSGRTIASNPLFPQARCHF